MSQLLVWITLLSLSLAHTQDECDCCGACTWYTNEPCFIHTHVSYTKASCLNYEWLSCLSFSLTHTGQVQLLRSTHMTYEWVKYQILTCLIYAYIMPRLWITLLSLFHSHTQDECDWCGVCTWRTHESCFIHTYVSYVSASCLKCKNSSVSLSHTHTGRVYCAARIQYMNEIQNLINYL